MYSLNNELIRLEIKKQGYKSLGDFADNIGLHRNMLGYYLSDKPIISEGLSKILDSLNLSLETVIVKEQKRKHFSLKDITPLVDELYLKYPNNIFVLFGSRARQTNAKYSDFDIGTYSNKKDFDYLKILNIKSDFADKVPFFVDLVNLNNADNGFLKNISKDWQLLAGKLSTWVSLNEKIR